MKISQIKKLYKEFGFKIAFSAACASRFKFAQEWKHKCVLNYLTEKYQNIILKYKNKNNNNEVHQSKIIWTSWWQGDENEILPEIVKMCLASMNKNGDIHPVKVITKNNYRDYVQLPDYIIKKVEESKITLAHLSDIIREYLLSKHGGLWADATIFMADKIPEEIFSMPYYTIKHLQNMRSKFISKEMWTGFFQAGEKGNILCEFVCDVLLEYWKEHDTLIDYFMIDYLIKIAIDEIPNAAKLFDNVPFNNPNIYELFNLLNSKWDAELYEKLKQNTTFFKLSWKNKYKKEIDGHETFYGHLLRRITNFTSCPS